MCMHPGGATPLNFTPDVWTQNVGKWVPFVSSVAKLAYSYMGVLYISNSMPVWVH